MKVFTRWAVGILAVGLVATGCTPSPEKVCDHIGELRAASGRGGSPESNARRRAECVTMMTAIRTANSGAYRTASRCLMGISGSDRNAENACLAPVAQYMH